MSCFCVPFKADHLWKVVTHVDVPEQLEQYLLSARDNYYRIGLINEMELSEATKVLPSSCSIIYVIITFNQVYDSIGHPPIWQKVPKADVPSTPAEVRHLWDSALSGPLVIIVRQYISQLREMQGILSLFSISSLPQSSSHPLINFCPEKFRVEGDENQSSEIDNLIMEIVSTGLDYTHHGGTMPAMPAMHFSPKSSFGVPPARLYSTCARSPSPYQNPLFRHLIGLHV